MDKLFTMFGKLHRTAKINNEGIGMGLMICQNLVKMNGGTISVRSDGEEKGSTFTFTMSMSLPTEIMSDRTNLGHSGGLTVQTSSALFGK